MQPKLSPPIILPATPATPVPGANELDMPDLEAPPDRWQFPWRSTAAGLVLLAVAGGWYWQAHRPHPPTFVTSPVDRGPIVSKVTASGTLSARVTVQVGAQVSGRIQQLNVDFNSPVHKGQVLARIDPQLFDAALAQARASGQA